MSHTLPSLISDIYHPLFTTLFWEVLWEKDLIKLTQYGIDTPFLERIQTNLHKKGSEKKKVLDYYPSTWSIEKITLFFPEKSELMDERSDAYRSLDPKTLIIPSEKEEEAYEALSLASYRYQEYLSEKKEYAFWFFLTDTQKIKKIQEKAPLYEAIYWARDLINMPPRDANPLSIVEEVSKKEWKNFTVRVFDQQELKKLGCNLLLAVGAGSDIPPYMLVLEPKDPPKTEKYALVGKGVTFDAGWIQIKPDTAMLDMKCDMSGAAGMIGVARYFDNFDTLPVNVVIAVWLTENMTGWSAFKPLDIYRAYNGKTVEIHHTDAEWRLVLADVMSYVEHTYKVDHIITMATLTWACVYALGHDIAWVMWDDEDVIGGLIESPSPYEKLWRLPLNQKLKKSLKAEIADLKNVARSEKAGSSVGGAFLTYFQWKAKLTHLDIAGPAYRESTYGYMPKWGTGWGVKILSEYLLSLKKKSK